MAKTSGRQVQIGLGIEATPGTAVAESIFLPWTSFSVQSVVEKSLFNSARGKRNQASNSMIRRKYAKGSIGMILNPANAPYLFGLALGTNANASNADGSGLVYDHTASVNNTNTSMKTATVTVSEGAVQVAQYLNCVCNSLTLEVSDNYAMATIEFIGQFAGSDTQSISYTAETEMAYHNYTAKFGTSLSNAASQTATPLKSFSVTINNNVQLDDAFLSGSNAITSGTLIVGPLKITGSYSLHYSDTTELAKYTANTLNALILTFTGASIGSSASELIKINLSRLVLTKPPLEFNIDGLVVINQEFEVQYNSTDSEMSVVTTNLNAGTSY